VAGQRTKLREPGGRHNRLDTVTGVLPLFPLGTVLFPGLVLPLHVFEPRYRDLVRDLMARPADEPREFGVIAIRTGEEVGADAAAELYDVGCAAELRQVKTYEDGRYDIVGVGRRRFRLTGVAEGEATYLTGAVEWLPDADGPPGDADRLAPSVLAAFRRYLRLLGDADGSGSGDDVGEQLPEGPTVLSHLVAATTSLALPDRQRLLAAPDTATRLRLERTLLHREAALLAEIKAVPIPLSELRVRPSPN